MTLSVIYEDADIVAVDKPAGLTVHKTGPNDQQTTLADLAVERWPQMKNVGEDPLRPGIVHRLDRDTSGIILLAKTQAAFSALKKQFQERTIRKTYLALVYGHPKVSMGTIDMPVGRIGAKTTTQTKGTRDLVERSAITDYKVLKTYPVKGAPSHSYALVQAMPRTGRTHQIRAHLKAIGCPIAGDPLYSSKLQVSSSKLGLDRPFLHAWKVEFVAPSGTALALEADLPGDLQKTLDMLESSPLS